MYRCRSYTLSFYSCITFTLIIQPDVSADEPEDSGMEDNRGIPGWDKVHNLAKALVSLKVH